LAAVFGRLGLSAFGGPAAHIALMRREVVEQRAWLTDGEFLNMVGASYALPGPASTQVAMYIGRRRAGTAGLVVAGSAFIVPGALLVGVLAWVYVNHGSTPTAGHLFEGVKPVIVAIVAIAVVRLARSAITSRGMAAIATATLVAYLAGVNEPALLLAAAAVGAVILRHPGRPTSAAVVLLPVLPAIVHHSPGPDLPRIFGVFFKIGALWFGSGYVLLAFLRRDLVLSRGWLTDTRLLDAVAVGQLTPGPLSTTATFVGYLLAGTRGAVTATVAIFLPSFLLVGAFEPVIARLRAFPLTAAALNGLNVGAVALMAGVAWSLGRDGIVDWPTALIALTTLGVLLRWKINPAWAIPVGALAGLLLPTIR
jgi:chromate transporter